jgi:hypothetical protein
MQKTATLVAMAAACAALSGCGGFKQAMGVEKVAPDEFRVVTRAPLVMPPDYALRPPRPGDPRPQELRPDGQARAAVFGQDVGAQATAGERALVARAGADAVDPAIRAQVDLEGAALVRKPEGFADSVINYQGAGQPAAGQTEEERLAAAETARRATGGAAVTIERREGDRTKLPGL